MSFLSGSTGYVKLGSTAYAFNKWRLDIKAGSPKVTNFTSGGYQQVVPGIVAGALSLSGPYNQGSMAVAVNGTYVFHLGMDTGVELSVSAQVTGVTVENDVEGTPMVSVTAETSGSFTSSIT